MVIIVAVAVKRVDGRSDMIRGIISFAAAVSLVFTCYVYTLGVGYHTTRLADRVEIEADPDISTEELYSDILEVVDCINREYSALDFRDGQTHMPYSRDEMSSKLTEAYDRMNEEYSLLNNFPSRVKSVHFSEIMSDLGIGGIYSFFTGEANINVEYPDYCLPYTAAHEMAHQRGISREDEANFVAFLVCISSDDAYIRYSGYLNMYEYLASSIYYADKDLYYESITLLPAEALSDIRASDAVYYKHMDSLLGKINDKLNDAYLKANGTEGVVSYGYVVRLTVGYYQKQNNG